MTKAADATSKGVGARQDAAGKVNYLENLLMRHLERLRNYDIDGAMALAEESHELALEIGREQILEDPAFAEHRERIRQIYSEVSLVIATERQEVTDKLKAIRQGLKTLEVYVDER